MCKFSYPLCLSARELSVTDSQYLTIRSCRSRVEEQLKGRPTDGWLHFAAAVCLSAERNYGQAMEHLAACGKAMASSPDSLTLAVAMHCLAADVRVKQSDLTARDGGLSAADDANLKYAGAINDLTAALGLDTNCAILYYNRATLYARSRDYARAVSDYTVALRLNPQLAEAYYNRGLVYIYTEKQQSGLADLSKAGELGLFTSYSLIKHYMKK